MDLSGLIAKKKKLFNRVFGMKYSLTLLEMQRFFAWDFDARKFVSPVDDAPPKSRMRRCSEFEAKLFNFVSNQPGWEEDFDRLYEDYMSHPKNANSEERARPEAVRSVRGRCEHGTEGVGHGKGE